MLGVFVFLVDGELEGFLELDAGFGATAEFEQEFAEEDAWHHPISFLFNAEFVVLDSVEKAEFGDESLGETEAKEFVIRLPSNKGGKGIGAPNYFAHGK